MNRLFCKASSVSRDEPVWIFLIGLAAILALIGPFGTFENLSLMGRIAYWGPLVFGANVFLRVSAFVVDRLFGTLPRIKWQLIMICIFSALFSPAVWVFNGTFSGRPQTNTDLLSVTSSVFAVTASVGFPTYSMTRFDAVQKRDKTRLYKRLPDSGNTARVTRLTVDDHYVLVYMDDSSCHRILMRFSDAVNEMDGTIGFNTHRSHWVATEHVVESLRENNRDYLLMRDGSKVPVSKSYRENVVASGFL